MEIVINNWGKYNLRKDVKRPSWFALSNRLIEDSDFYTFSGGEFKAWIYILSQASQKQSDTININFSHADRACLISKSDFLKSIEKLVLIQVITVHVTSTLRERDEDVTSQTNNTGQDRTNRTNSTAHVRERNVEFDFELLYKNYPLKKGKAGGMARLKKIIKSQLDFDSFLKAIEKYTRDIQIKGTESKYIKHFSSFVGSDKNQPWRDWLDEDAGSSIAVIANPKTNYADQRSASNQNSLEAYKQTLREKEKTK